MHRSVFLFLFFFFWFHVKYALNGFDRDQINRCQPGTGSNGLSIGWVSSNMNLSQNISLESGVRVLVSLTFKYHYEMFSSKDIGYCRIFVFAKYLGP